MLKKEFQRKDVERMRNLIKGKGNESAEIQVGYNKKNEDHQEGDTWEEDGRTWTIKNGIKQNITRLDKIKSKAKTPLFCPECKKVMKKQTDPKMYKIHSKCTDCVVEREHRIRLEGKWDEYEKNIITANANAYTDMMEAYLMDAINSSNQGFVSENGEIERWVGGIDKEEATKEIKEAVEHLRKNIIEYATGKSTENETNTSTEGTSNI